MSIGERTFEVHMLINGIKKMFHFRDLKNHRQAEIRAKKLAGKRDGQILSIRKVDVSEWPRGVELMRLAKQPRGLYLGGGLYDGDITDEMLGFGGKPKGNKKRKRGT